MTQIPEYLIFNLESLISNEPSKIIAPQVMHYKIETMFEFVFEKIKYNYGLISMLLFEDENHFTLYYKNPKFEGRRYNGWFYYNDLAGYVQEETINLDLNSLIQKRRVSLLLVYKL